MEKSEQIIKFKRNLQTLRKRASLSQEELAEKINVSRQSVSKWESGDAYPEMKMLLILCDLFHVSLDELVHGNIEVKESMPIRQKYEKLIRRRATMVPIGICLILIGVTIMLVLQGVFNLSDTDFESLAIVPLLALIAVAVVLFVIAGNEENDFKRRHRSLPNIYTADEVEVASSRQHYLIATGIGIIILGAAALMAVVALEQNDITAVAMLLVFVSVGVPLIVRGGIIKDSYDIKQYNQENSMKSKSQEEKISAVSGIVMMLATIIYLITGFAFNLWGVTWWVFPVGSILCGISAIIIKTTLK